MDRGRILQIDRSARRGIRLQPRGFPPPQPAGGGMPEGVQGGQSLPARNCPSHRTEVRDRLLREDRPLCRHLEVPAEEHDRAGPGRDHVVLGSSASRDRVDGLRHIPGKHRRHCRDAVGAVCRRRCRSGLDLDRVANVPPRRHPGLLHRHARRIPRKDLCRSEVAAPLRRRKNRSRLPTVTPMAQYQYDSTFFDYVDRSAATSAAAVIDELFAAIKPKSAFDCLRPRIHRRSEIEPWYRYTAILFANDAGCERLSAEALASALPQGQRVPEYGSLGWRFRCWIVRRIPSALAHALAQWKHKLFLLKARTK